MDVHLRLLGPLEVWDGVAARKIGGTKERTLLAHLALNAGHPVSVDAIADALWGADPPPSAAKGIPVLVTRLRKALSAPPAVPIELDRVGEGYRLRMPSGAIDVTVAESLARAAELAAAAGELDQAAQTLARAEALWRGPSLAGIHDEPFAVADAQRLDELRVRLLEDRVDVDIRRGRHDAVLADLEAACVAHPLRERLWELRMLALHRAGRTPEALRAFQAVRTLMIDEIGLEPSEELRGLEAAIVRDDPALRPDPRSVRELPSGEITLVLTDVAGSTRLWERAPDAMGTALARHDQLVKEVIGSRGGVVLKSRGEGDATFSVFEDAARAAGAAVDLQRAFTAEPWPADAPLLVRVAVHTGRADLRDGDYYGPTVNRVARLRAAGHGGQILLSAATTALIRDRLPDDVTLRDLGLRRLRDLLEPEHIFQVEHPALPDRFPPLATLDARPNNLPVQPTAFIGRDRAVAALTALLRSSDARFVTLTGPGGIGKTRLAVRVAADVIDDFPDGVWFVPLAAVAAAEAVPGTIAAVLDVQPQGDEMLTDAIARHVADRRLLLVLDNFEQVVDAAELVADLHLRCPNLTMLATSREWLHVRAEREVRVEALDEASATALFFERARAVRIDADDWLDPASVAEICRALDGLPLAIELVAARLRTFALDELRAQLRAVLDLASEGPRDQPARQRTLRDTVAWSIGLLTPAERDGALALSVFRGGWTLPAGAAVIGVGVDDAAVVVASLADKSLVTQPGAERYDMLATIRTFAEEQLASSPAALEGTRLAHLAYWASVVDNAISAAGGLHERLWDDFGSSDPKALVELDNLRAALDHAITSHSDRVAPLTLWVVALLVRVDLREALERVEAAFAAIEDPEWQYWLSVARVSVLWGLGRAAEVETCAGRLIEQTGRDRPGGRLALLDRVAIAQWRLGRFDDADATLERALSLSTVDDSGQRALLLHSRGLVATTRGDLRAAAEWYREAGQAEPDDALRAVIDVRMGQTALLLGRADEAAQLLAPLVESTTAVPVSRAMAAYSLVIALIERGDTGAAVDAALDIVHQARRWEPQAQVYAGLALASARLATGDPAGAETAAEETVAIVTRASVTELRPHVWQALGLARLGRGDLAGAHRALADAIEYDGAAGRTGAHCDLAVVERALGDTEGAWARQVAALERDAATGSAIRCANTCCYLADFAADRGLLPLAAILLGAAGGLRAAAGAVAGPVRARGTEAAATLLGAASPALDDAQARGRTMPIDDVLALVKQT